MKMGIGFYIFLHGYIGAVLICINRRTSVHLQCLTCLLVHVPLCPFLFLCLFLKRGNMSMGKRWIMSVWPLKVEPEASTNIPRESRIYQVFHARPAS